MRAAARRRYRMLGVRYHSAAALRRRGADDGNQSNRQDRKRPSDRHHRGQCEDAGLTKVEFLPSEIAIDL